MTVRGGSLSDIDLQRLAGSGIDAELAASAFLRRVDTFDGAEIVGRNGKADYAGIVFPYTWPGEGHVREYRLRRDKPDFEQAADGKLKEVGKYLSPPGRGSMLYFHPDSQEQWLSDNRVDIVLTEGEKKCLALWALAWHGLSDNAERPRWLPIAIPGVWNFRGVVGKAEGPDGDRRDLKGPIADLQRINWQGRKVAILFDANTETNESVRIARYSIAKELRTRGAKVFFVDMPNDAGVNGVDDLVGVWGQDRVIDLIRTKAYDPQKKTPAPEESSVRRIADLPSVSDMPVEEVDFLVDGLLAYSTVNMWSGEAGCGKTSVGMKVCYCRSTGTPFAGMAVRMGPALYIDCEQSRSVIQEKFGRLKIKDGELFKLWGPWAGNPPDLSSPLLLDYVRECDPKPLIVIDSFVAYHPGDENDSGETRAFIQQARELANLGACVLFLHHPGKSESAKVYRGSSDIGPALDVGYFVSNIGDSGKLEKIRMKVFKERISVVRDLILEYVDGDFVSDARPDVISRTVTERLIEILKAHPGVKTLEFEGLATASKLSSDRAREFLKNGVATGQIRKESGPHNRKFHYWEGGHEVHAF